MSFAITTAATEGAGAGTKGSASPRKRQRTDAGTTEAATAALAKQLFVEAGSPISVAKAVKNNVGWSGDAFPQHCQQDCIRQANNQLYVHAALWATTVPRNRTFVNRLGWGPG